MRIVIASHVNSQSGRSRAFLALHDLLTDLGHRVTVLVPDHKLTAPLYPSRYPVAVEPVPGVRGDYTAREGPARAGVDFDGSVRS